MPRKLSLLVATAACTIGWMAGASATTCTTNSCTISNPYTAPSTVAQPNRMAKKAPKWS